MNTTISHPDREDIAIVKEQYSSLKAVPHLKSILDAASIIFFIVNEQRQIVFSNQFFLERLKLDSVEELLGLRPGEAIGCDNADRMPSGCGGTKFCSKCGMLGSIFGALKANDRVTREAVVVLVGKEEYQLNLEVTASPFQHDGKRFVYFSAIDIEQRKRKELMENIFFHDVLNLIMSLEGYLEMMDGLTENERNRFFPTVRHISNQLHEEITSQRELVKAENNQLMVQTREVDALKVLSDIKGKMQFSRAAKNKNIKIIAVDGDVMVITDLTLLNRILINMLKNACEASENGDTITLSVKPKENDTVCFTVHNPGFMPEEVQLQIFKRSVSTKGTGRGLGTYSMKLLGERYLQGAVKFKSHPENGTAFYLEIPRQITGD